MRSALILVVALAAASVAAQSPVLAQGSRIVDEGSFTISIGGRTVGRENFRISATAAGEVTEYAARADVTFGDRKVTPELRAGAQGAVMEYGVTTRSGGASDSWTGALARGRLNATIKSGRGTAAREYVVPAGTVLLDDETIHQYWFLVLRTRSGAIPVVVPRRSNVQATVTMATIGEETVRIGNHDLPATYLRATFDDGDARDIWVDRTGRLLKVAIPARELVAVRDDPPPA